jgi:membrane protease YdiL (CAAX protease family)
LIALPQVLLDNVSSKPLPPNLTTIIVNTFLYNISFITIIEEACFRGLLVGFIIMSGYKENAAFVFQAILFWIGHYMVISNPVTFFISIPLLTLSTTLIMKKYKIVFLPIIVHTFVNIFTSIFVVVLQQYFA